MPIIRATQRNRGVHAQAFNFDDMGRSADAYLNRVRDEAKKILASAVEEAAEIRRRAETEGLASAEDIIAQKVRAELEPVLPALRTAVEELRAARPAWLSHWQTRTVHLACAIAKRIIRRELSETPEITLELVREALELAIGQDDVRLLLNPDDYAALRPAVDALVAELSRMAPSAVLADASIRPGGCRVETRFGSIDQQIESQLARIEAELA